MPIIDNSSLAAALQNNRVDLETIFTQRLQSLNGEVRGDFRAVRASKTYAMKRKTSFNQAQPDPMTNAWNPSPAIATFNERIATLQACKADVEWTQADIEATNTSWIAEKDPNDPNDIHSIAGLKWMLQDVYNGIDNNIVNGIWAGVRNTGTGLNGGTNLYDGLNFHLLASFVASEMTVGNNTVVTLASAATTEANILAQFKAVSTKIRGNKQLNLEYTRGKGDLYVPPLFIDFAREAQNSAFTNGSMVVAKEGTNDYKLNAFPNITVKPRNWMFGLDQMLLTPADNLFIGSQDGGAEAGVPSLKFQENIRALRAIFGWKMFINYADPRSMLVFRALT